MPYNLLIIPLIAGYYLLSNLDTFKFKYQRQDSQRLILNSALGAIIILIVTFTLREIASYFCPNLIHKLHYLIQRIFDYNSDSTRFIGTMLVALFGTILFTKIVNFAIRKFGNSLRLRYLVNIVEEHGDELEKLFTQSVLNEWPVQITLKNNKVYLGFIDEIPVPGKTNYFNIIPLYSGYRESDTKNLVLTTSYETVHDLLDLDDDNDKISMMVVTVKQDEVLSASPHDHDVYQRFVQTTQ